MYRLYIDETGNGDLGASSDPNHRFLSLTGVAIALDHASDFAFPTIEALKADFFGSHPDDPVILHRKDIANRRKPFHALKDRNVESAFNQRLLKFLDDLEFVAMTVVIDKAEHLSRYQVWRHDPYHYCLEVLMERYVLWLRNHNQTGDVMAEVRSGKHDRQLEKSFARLYRRGSSFVGQQHFERRLTSGKLKMKSKQANVAGLQVADLLAHPSAGYARQVFLGTAQRSPFAARISSILAQDKYYRSSTGAVAGYGLKMLP